MKRHSKKTYSVLAAIGLLLLSATLLFKQFSSQASFINSDLDLTQQLSIPEMIKPETVDGKKTYNLTLQEGATEFTEGVSTTTWGANGSYLMPTLMADEGDEVQVNITNELGEMTTIHWHGMHVPAAVDGVHQVIQSGETWQPEWEVKQEAAPLWYHPHMHGKSGEQVYNGLAGMFIVEDENSKSLDLPRTYGVDDVPVIVQDRQFDESGQFVYDPGGSSERNNDRNDIRDVMLGDTLLVNGTLAPFHETPEGMVRLRILNGSNARRYNFGFDDNKKFYQIASDGGFLNSPVEHERLLLSPGERAEILVDMSDGAARTLMSYAPGESGGLFSSDRGLGDEQDEFKVMELRTNSELTAHTTMPETLNSLPEIDDSVAVNTREFELGHDHTINDRTMDIERIDEIVYLNEYEVWEVTNDTGVYHNFHIHDIQFRVLDRDGNAPLPQNAGLKDTVIIDEDETVRLLVQFTDYANPNIPYMYHCHMLEHEDHGMMGQFVVIERGQEDEVGVVSELLDLNKRGVIHEHDHSSHSR